MNARRFHPRRVCARLAHAGVLALLTLGADTGGAEAQSYAIGWTQLTNTEIQDVCPQNTSAYAFRDYCRNIILAWNSGVVDTLRNRLIVWGGGHGDYYGNEVYAIDLSSKTVQRLNNPSPLAGSVHYPTCPESLPDGAANSRHTYDGIAYIEHLDRLFVFGGSLACGGGWSSRGTWTFDFKTLAWRRMNPSGPLPKASYGVVTAYDPTTKKVYLHDLYNLYAYTYETDSFQRLSPDPQTTVIDYHMTAAIDTKRRKFVIVGGNSSNNGGVTVYDLNAGSPTPQKWTTSGGSSIINKSSPGLAYEPGSDRMVAWAGGDTVYSLNMDTRTWTATTFAGGPGAGAPNGTFGRWDYVPKLGVIATVSSVFANAFVLRLSQSAATSDTTPPTVSITAPTGGSTVSGTVTVSANASDNVGVAGVQFLLDGAPLEALDPTAPYSVLWYSAATTNGSHTLTAVAYDAAGNTKTSAAVTVTVSNSASGSGLVAAFGFNEGSGASTTDATGSSQTGSITGATWTTAGKFGNALSFGGSNSWVTVADSPLLDLTGSMTLSAWVYPTANSGFRTVLLKEQTGNEVYSLYSSNAASVPITGIAQGGVSGISTTAGSQALPLNTWSYLTATYDGATLRLFVNAAQVGSRAASGSLQTSSGPLRIGGNSIWGEYFQGRIDEVRVYNRALTTTQIQSGMNTPVAGDTVKPTVSVTAPAAGATVSGTVTVTATASDNVGVVGVQFKLDGANLGAEDTTAPYSVSWSTTTAANGTHTLTAVARDATGNVTTSASVTVTVSNAVSGSGLVAAYAFSENSGTITADATGNGHTGTLINGTTWTASGKNGSALSCDGVNDRVDITDSTLLDLTTGMTLEAWVNPSAGAMTGFRGVLVKGGSTSPQRAAYDFVANNLANVPASEVVIGGTSYVAPGTTKLPSGTWSHLATTYDGTTLRLYVNGAQVGSRAVTGAMAASTLPLQLCGNTIWSGEYFGGKVDDIRIYNRALITTQIQADMTTPVGSATSSAAASPLSAGDQAAPTVSLTAPSAGTTLQGTAAVSATAADNIGVAGVQFRLDGVNLGSEDTAAPYTVAWDTRTAGNGSRVLTAVARDAAGNRTTSAVVTVTVSNAAADTTKPTISLTAPAPGATVSGVVTVSGVASDNVGVVGVQFKRDGVSLGAEDTTSPYSIAWDSKTVTNGSHTLIAVARDAAGNTTTSTGIAVSVANAGTTRTVRPMDAWCSIVNGARPGDQIVFAPGTYATTCWITAVGTASAPITVRSQSETPGSQATFAYTGSTANVLELRNAAFLTVRGFAFAPTQPDVDAIRLWAAHDVRIEANTFRGIGGISISANTNDVRQITVRGNTFVDVADTALYFGCHDGVACHATTLLIEDNVIDGVTSPGVGYGLEIKLNSWGTVRGNTIARTQGPGIMVYGSSRGDPASVVEQNYVDGSRTEAGIVVGGGPAIVRNNILVDNAGGGISAQNYGGRNLQRDVWIVHNTLVRNIHSGINVAGWSTGNGNVIADNAILPRLGTPILSPAAPAGTIIGNLTCTSACFVQATTSPYDLTPAAGSPLVNAAGSGPAVWRPADDFFGDPRGSAADVGAIERP